MFDSSATGGGSSASQTTQQATAGVVTAPALRAAVAALAAASGPEGSGAAADAERLELIRALEDLKNAAAGYQAALTAAFDASQLAQQRDAGLPKHRRGRGIAAQIALARRVSPHRGQQHLSLARILQSELPSTARAMRSGLITERSATLMARGTTCLSREDRLLVDQQVAGDPEAVERLGERGVQGAVARWASRLDPAAVVGQRRRAESERCVTLRPAPDTMTYLTALLPVADGVAVYAALTRAADSATAAGTTRTRGQLMADMLCESVLAAATAGPGAAAPGGERADCGAMRPAPATGTGPAAAHTSDVDEPAGVSVTEIRGAPAGTGVVINLLMTERQLFGTGEVSEGEVFMEGYGLVDADLARQMAALTPADRVWLRRIYAHPTSGELVALDSRRRRFPTGVQQLIRLRDQYCRTPWCGAPIRQADHARSHARGGGTSLSNGQGKCQACNLAKEAPGWSTESVDEGGGRHRVVTTTPTGQQYTTGPPEPPGPRSPRSGTDRERRREVTLTFRPRNVA